MLKYEYKILKYIYRHEGKSAKQLTEKFPYIDDYYFRIKKYLDEEPAINIYSESVCAKKGLDENETVICINLEGEEIVERKRHEFWSFFFPYAITTLVALASVIAQIAPLFNKPA